MPRSAVLAPLLIACAFLIACAREEAAVTAGASAERVSDRSASSAEVDAFLDASGDLRVTPQMDAATELHHWQSIAAAKAGDARSALHHVQHILDEVTGEHRRAMEEVAEFLIAGDFHSAEHIIEQMLGGRATADLSPRQMHLQLALYSLENGDAEEATHHIAHADQSLPSHVLADGVQAAGVIDQAEVLRGLLSTVIDADLSGTECWRAALSPGQAALKVVVGLDSDWVAHLGADAFSAAEELVTDADRILGAVGASLEIVDMFEWTASPATDRAGLERRLADFPWSADADLAILLTTRDLLAGSDGTYLGERRVAVVWHHHTTFSSDSLVLVHEVGHHLGMLHRPGTYMQAHAFPLAAVWSDCQRDGTQTSG